MPDSLDPASLSSAARTVQQVIDAGMPFVQASGIESNVYHQGGCHGSFPGSGGECPCGVNAEMNRLAIEFSKSLDKYGRP